MVKKVWKSFKNLNGTWLVLLILVLIAGVHCTIRIFELLSSRQNCAYDEPIDIVYTWVNGSDPRFIEQMNTYLKTNSQGGSIDSSKQRYEDKNELRFSLRSLEKYAPWFNHVYLVTNGQIPYWLNLDYEKITVITHEEIFRDQDNLPTFSSPAIESNLHRIPGLSDKFIYFNDDIFIGQPMYLDDFYSKTKGYLIFLAYILPSCTRNCPWLYVGDGQCDVGCNNAKCQFDGGDCDNQQGILAVLKSGLSASQSTESQNSKLKQELDYLRDNERLVLYPTISAKNNSDQNNNVNNITTTKSENASINNNYRKVKLNTVGFKTEKLLKGGNGTIAKLVQEHNNRILGKNKTIRRRRSPFIPSVHFEPLKRPSHNINGFLESLMYTQRIFNKKYGFRSRYVPAHAPILIEKNIMQELENAFSTEFELTERNRFRHKDDMQFGFSYYYYAMSETIERSVEEIFDEFDTDGSLTWSDREIRNLLTKIYELPLSYDIVDHFESILLNCSELLGPSDIPTPPYERYIDSRLPTISKDLINRCHFLNKFLTNKFGRKPKYQFRVVKDAEKSIAAFRMMVSNVSNAVMNLDEIRSNPTKFVCLNDNLDEAKTTENELIRAILYDFYLSLFPHPSKFELPENSRNRFLHIDDLKEWRRRHRLVQIFLCLAILSMVVITFFNVFKKGICRMFREVCV